MAEPKEPDDPGSGEGDPLDLDAFAVFDPEAGEAALRKRLNLQLDKKDEDELEFGQVAKKPRARGATYSGLKGDWMEASVIAKSGLPQRWMAFVGKYKQDVVTLVIIVDEREARLHKDYLKQVCSNFDIAK